MVSGLPAISRRGGSILRLVMNSALTPRRRPQGRVGQALGLRASRPAMRSIQGRLCFSRICSQCRYRARRPTAGGAWLAYYIADGC